MPRLPWGFDRTQMIGYFLTLIDRGGTTTAVGELAKRVLAEYGGDALERNVTRQHGHETLSWWEEPSGMIGLRACLAADHAAVVIAGIAARSAPQPQVDPETGAVIRDPRSAGKRRADALVELVTRAVCVDVESPMGAAATLVVTVDLDTLLATTVQTGAASDAHDHTDLHGHPHADQDGQPRGGRGYATTGENTTVDVGALRRYACDANLIPVVLGTGSAPLDVGRTKRLATREMRVALALRDRGCTFPGCDRPPGWCRAHHLLPWAAGGATTLDNLVLLCERHHTIVHRDHLTATIHLDPLDTDHGGDHNGDEDHGGNGIQWRAPERPTDAA